MQETQISKSILTNDNSYPETDLSAPRPYEKYFPEPTETIKEQIRHATGSLPFRLTNDYFFRAFLQENNIVLKHLICAILHLSPKQIYSVEITNPILLGKRVPSKTFILDVHVILNNQTSIDLEMQVVKFDHWPERSLGYLCRSYDSLNKGETYDKTKPAIHIGFLDHTLFPEYPEFHAVYKLLNEKNYIIYTDKFMLHVIDLSHIELATEEDQYYEIDKWASLFKANTWEDIKMLAEKTPLFESAAETIQQIISDEQIRWLCESREASELTLRTYESQLADKDAEIADKDAEIARLTSLLAENNIPTK